MVVWWCGGVVVWWCGGVVVWWAVCGGWRVAGGVSFKCIHTLASFKRAIKFLESRQLHYRAVGRTGPMGRK